MQIQKLSALVATAAVAAGAVAPAAANAKATGKGVHKVTKQVYVYDQPGKIFDGTVFKGDTVTVKRISKSGKWAFAYVNRISRHAWISSAALTKKN